MAYCTQCGRHLRDGAHFCTNCGNKVRNTSQSTSRNSRSYQQPKNEQKVRKTPSYTTPIVFQTKQPSSITDSSLEIESETVSDEAVINEVIEDPQEELIETSTNRDLQTDPNSETQLEMISENEANSTESQIIDSKIEKSQENSLKEELKEALMRIKYSFKNLNEPEPYLFNATFLAGSIKNLEWNFQNGFELFASLPDNVNQKIKFSIDLDDNRPQYDWKNPYNNVNFKNEFEDERILMKIKREGRVIEKLSRIKGTVRTKVNGSNLTIKVESITPENIRPALDAIKEIAWLMDITLK